MKVKEIVKDYVFKCMTKDTTIIFHPTNNQTVPPPAPFGTREVRPKTSHRMKEFFNVNTPQTGMTIYFTINSSITVMQVKHRVYQLLTVNNVLMNKKKIQEN